MNAVYEPGTASDAARWILARAGRAFEICGAGTRRVPSNMDQLRTRKLNRVRFFDPDDMVIGVEAGLPYRDLAALLAEESMVLPVSPWFENATIGGMAAACDYGPERLLGGGLRDFIIGIEYVNGEGQLVKAGGKVVKNVTGYDLNRMMIGSRGGLGLITALHFKVLPAPAEPHCLLYQTEDASWLKALAAAHHEKIPLQHAQAVWFDGLWRLCLGIAGNRARRERLIRDLQAVFGGVLTPASENMLPPAYAFFSPSQRIGGFLAPHVRGRKSLLHLHVTIPTGAFLERDLQHWSEGADLVVAHPVGSDVHLIYENPSNPQLTVAIMARKAAAEGGFLSIEKGPPSLMNWSVRPLPAEYAFMKRLKKGLDPKGLFHAPFYEQDEGR